MTIHLFVLQTNLILLSTSTVLLITASFIIDRYMDIRQISTIFFFIFSTFIILASHFIFLSKLHFLLYSHIIICALLKWKNYI
ncbi:hypothetical protein KSF78_0004393 [Schistosoma japonicum]|nr:hypothetical protein KSF78_0004393 [Schistosoma japonicum]